MDLVSDLPVPGVPAAQLALIEKDFDAACAERFSNLLRRLGILRGVAQKYRVRCLSQCGPPLKPEVFPPPWGGSLAQVGNVGRNRAVVAVLSALWPLNGSYWESHPAARGRLGSL